MRQVDCLGQALAHELLPNELSIASLKSNTPASGECCELIEHFDAQFRGGHAPCRKPFFEPLRRTGGLVPTGQSMHCLAAHPRSVSP